MIDVTTALSAYTKMLTKEKEITDSYKKELAKIKEAKEKFENFLLQAGDVSDIPDIVKDMSPYLTWKISPKTDSSTIAAHMLIDDVLIPKMEKVTKESVAILKEQRSEIETWMLKILLEREASHISVKGVGRAECRTNNKYSIENKKAFVSWTVEEGVEDELTITLRPNSKFIARVVEETGELPPAVKSYRENKIVFVKA